MGGQLIEGMLRGALVSAASGCLRSNTSKSSVKVINGR